jgi:hypothetical protein
LLLMVVLIFFQISSALVPILVSQDEDYRSMTTRQDDPGNKETLQYGIYNMVPTNVIQIF